MDDLPWIRLPLLLERLAPPDDAEQSLVIFPARLVVWMLECRLSLAFLVAASSGRQRRRLDGEATPSAREPCMRSGRGSKIARGIASGSLVE